MTLRQDKLLKAIPESKTLAEAARKAKLSTKSGNLYRKSTRKYIKEFLEHSGIDKEGLIEKFKMLANIGLSEKDLSNGNRALENLARIQGLLKDNIEVKDTTNQAEQDEYLALKRRITPQDIVEKAQENN